MAGNGDEILLVMSFLIGLFLLPYKSNLVPRVSLLPAKSDTIAFGGNKRDHGNEVELKERDEDRKTSKKQTKMPRFMLEGPRPCTILNC